MKNVNFEIPLCKKPEEERQNMKIEKVFLKCIRKKIKKKEELFL
jgi:hypothetical protein